jgi:ADP-ribosylglycohydrolase
MEPSARQLILPSLVADALCLGPHWIYDTRKILDLYPDHIQRHSSPQSPYHSGKAAGDFTHYGDQTLALLRSLVLRGGFDADGWREDWQGFWKSDPPSYRDGATKATLQSLEQGAHSPSDSNDLAGAARIAPLVAALADASLDARIHAARAQTALTHGDPATIDAAEFFTRVVDDIAKGSAIAAALTSAAGGAYGALDASSHLGAARALLEQDPEATGAKLGLTCHTADAFPLSLYFLMKFAESPREALIANAMAGGDSAARGLLIGLVMGAAHGTAWMPAGWIGELSAAAEIEDLLASLDRAHPAAADPAEL